MVPEAPVRYSSTSGWPRMADTFVSIVRTMMSAGPPGADGTITRMGRFG